MAKRANIPQSQAPYHPGRATAGPTAATRTELRQRSPINYDQSQSDGQPSSQRDTSSDDGEYWPIKCILAERGKGSKKKYKVEWEGTDPNGNPWPFDWKEACEITEEALKAWEEKKHRKRTREASPPTPKTVVGIDEHGRSEQVRVSKKEKERFRRERKKQKAEPKVASAESSFPLSAIHEESENVVIGSDPSEKGPSEAIIHDPSSGEKVRSRSRRRRILGSSQSIDIYELETTGSPENEEGDEDQELGEIDPTDSEELHDSGLLKIDTIVVEIPPRELDRSEYIVYETPEPSYEIIDISDDEGGEPLEFGLALSEDDLDTFQTCEEDNIVPEVEIQVPQSQNNRKERREVPDSQSSGRRIINMSSTDEQSVVPETPANVRLLIPIPISSSYDPLEPIEEASNFANAIHDGQVLQSDRGDQMADVPDSSNRIFSQDVRELKSQETSSASQSQSSKESQKSIPSGQLSVGKVGVNRSHESLQEENATFLEDQDIAAELGTSVEMEQATGTCSNSNIAGQKCVVSEAAPTLGVDRLQLPFAFRTSLQPSQLHHPDPERLSESALNEEYVTANSVHEPLILVDSSPGGNYFSVHQSRASTSHRDSILQLAVESPIPGTLDSINKSQQNPSSRLAQLEVPLPSDSRDISQAEARGSDDSSSNRNLQPFNPSPYSTNFETFPPPILSPTTPIGEDPLQTVRSTSSTPCGPIPASVTPAPVTVLGYFPSERKQGGGLQDTVQKSSPAKGHILKSSTALQQAISSSETLRESSIPLKETRVDIDKHQIGEIADNTMSGAPASPISRMVDVASVFEHHLSPSQPSSVPRTSGLLFSQHAVTSLRELSPSSQEGEIFAPELLSNQEVTSSQKHQPSPDDDLILGSQTWSLIRDPVRSTPTETYLAVPLTEYQRTLYEQTLLQKYHEVETFVGFQSTQNNAKDISIQEMEGYLHELEAITCHADLVDEDEDVSQSSPGQNIIEWYCKQSSKIAILSMLFEQIKNDSYIVALVANDEKFMNYLELFLQSGHYNFTRYHKDQTDSDSSMEENPEELHVFLVPSKGSIEQKALPMADLIIGLDSTMDTRSLHIKSLQRNKAGSSDPAPTVHFVAINTVPHVTLCLPPADELVPREYMNAVLFTSLFIREKAGVLPSELASHHQLLSSNGAYSWIENIQLRGEHLLPPLQIPSLNSNGGQDVMPEVAAGQSPARKRVLSLSTIPASPPGGKHKKARLDSNPASPGINEDEMMRSDENAQQDTRAKASSSEDGRLESQGIERPRSILPTADTFSSDPVSFPESLDGEPSEDLENKSLEVVKDTEEKEMNETNTQKGELEGFPEASKNDLEENEEGGRFDVLYANLDRDDLIQMVLEAQSSANEWESALTDLQNIHEDRLARFRELTKDMENKHGIQKIELSHMTKQRDKFKTAAELAISERDAAKQDLVAFRAALDTGSEQAQALGELMDEKTVLQKKIATLERNSKSMANEMEFFKEQYREASTHSGMMMKLNADLEEELVIYKRRADDVKLELKSLNMDRERAKLQAKIKELQSKLDQRTKHTIKLESERRRNERARGLQTRSTSIPPRGVQSSPAPTRPASPSPIIHRHLLRGADQL